MALASRRLPGVINGSFIVAAALWLLVLVLMVVSVLGFTFFDWSHAHSDLKPNTSDIVSIVPIMAFATVGGLIAWRQPRNSIGWLLIATGVLATFLETPKLYAGLALDQHIGWLPAPLWVYWVGNFSWVFVFALFLIVLPLLYPDGRLPSRRWRLIWIPLGLLLLLAVLSSFDPKAAPAGLPNPAAVDAAIGLGDLVVAPFLILIIGTSAAAVASLVVRYRRGALRDRQQLKWLLVAAGLILLAFSANIILPTFTGGFFSDVLLPLAITALPIAVGIAILRYGLYDIDFIISKALVYGGLAILITVGYVLVVVGIGALVGRTEQFLLSLVTTAVIALAFQPLRQRAQRMANRLVYGPRATPYETMSQFSEHLSETFSQEDILDRMARILAQGTGAERAEVWVRAGHRLLLASSSLPLDGSVPRELPLENGSLPPMERDRVAPVSHQGELLGALAVVKKRGESMNMVEEKLVSDLAAQAGLVLKNVGLNRELLARLDDLRASRQRLVTAQDEERRRIERNIHDGAQQHLVALKIKVGVAESLSAPDSRARPILAQLKQDADEAIDTLRELARGIYPPLLASDGLEVALRSQTRRLAFPVVLSVDRIPRQPREIEGAIYFCCLEAMQNAAKYAQASRVELRIWLEDSRLAFRVTDDGQGFDPAAVRLSSGLQNMRDRLEALGGSLKVEAAPGIGTSVEGRVPAARLEQREP
jgi:signal transduction histidine kinase